MLIDCPSCARSYHVSRAALGSEGRTVICPACHERWYVAVADLAFEAPEPRGPVRTDLRAERRSLPPPPAPRPRRAPRSMRPPAAWPLAAAAACLVLSMVAIGARRAVVAAVPRTAALYEAIGLPVNVRGLEFSHLETVRTDDPGQRVEISGRIHNLARQRTPLPRITFDIRDAKGESLTRWTQSAPRRALAGDESVAFVTQAPSLPDGAKDIVVRFEAPAKVAPLLGTVLSGRAR